ncbi:hypothetical protein [Chachezhania antarctica]|uniref:hypothetical protein n=1 Tax=Chachezhania antarctica TaxID=2340860 RepID=UPI000EAC23A5|nr:hypothetical protein [Chachezhania antarctica]|tara:strand:- start:3585 stop:3788 length:204 start_codon:yes stop_codon:yes gene_type:complete
MYRFALPALLAVALTLSGCIGFGGRKINNVEAVSIGQQLEDLEKARQEGLLSPKEYKRERKDILKAN